MMRQTKAMLTTGGVTGVLVAGLFLFGCNRQAGDAQEGDDVHTSAPHYESDDAKTPGTAGEDGHSNADEGGGHEMSGADERLRSER